MRTREEICAEIRRGLAEVASQSKGRIGFHENPTFDLRSAHPRAVLERANDLAEERAKARYEFFDAMYRCVERGDIEGARRCLRQAIDHNEAVEAAWQHLLRGAVAHLAARTPPPPTG